MAKYRHSEETKRKISLKAMGRPSSTKTHGMTDSRPWLCWRQMRRRCDNPEAKGYKYYGGKGIGYENGWESFEVFWADMKIGYKDDLTLDRIDGKKDYSKENCRWATKKEQMNNKSDNRLISFNGLTLTMSQWADKIGMNYGTLKSRFNNLHLPPEIALTAGYRKCRRITK